MWIKNPKIVIPILVVLAAAIVWFVTNSTPSNIGRTTIQPAFAEKGAAAIQTPLAAGKTYKILHVMSFHSPWEWTDSQFNSFKDAFQGVPVEFKVYQMDAKRQSSKGHLEQAGKEARQIIETWKPDLVFISDDPGMVEVTTHYLNQKLPIVFSAVNADPEDYKLDGVSNVTGVLEREHVIETFRLLKKLVPNVHKVAIISDKAPMWAQVIRRMKEQEKNLATEGIEIVKYDIPETFEQFKQIVKDYEGKVDAVGYLGIFGFKDSSGKNVLYQDVRALGG